MDSIQKYILQKIAERKREGNFRSLKLIEGKVDLTSNDYLGIARDKDFQVMVDAEIQRNQKLLGSTGSRLRRAIVPMLRHWKNRSQLFIAQRLR